MIEVKVVSTKKELEQFVKFQFEIFKNNDFWVPPLIFDEMDTFDKSKNPTLKNCDIRLLLAYKNHKIVGRVAAVVNWEEVNKLGKSKTRFGWFDVIDDVEVTKALLDEVYKFGKEKGMDHVEGPLGFSNLDKVGVLIEGFDQLSTAISWYSMPYYKEHFEKLGYQQEKVWQETIFSFDNVNADAFLRASSLIASRYNISIKNFKKTAEILPYVNDMFQLFNETYSKLESFVAVTPEQIEHIKDKFIKFINPEYIKFILDKDNNILAFAIVMPNFAQALQKAKGKLFPFGWWHILDAKKNSKEAVFYLIGVTPEYQNKGITALIMADYYKVFKEKGIKTCISTPELVDNHAIHNLWKNFGPKVNKMRATYIKSID